MVASAGVAFVFLSELEDDFGVPGWGIGVVVAMGFLAPLVASLSLAPLADRGRTGLLAGLALGSTVLGNLVFGFGTTLWMFVLGRALVGIGIGLFLVVARKALIGTVTSGGGKKLGTYMSVVVAGFIMGPPLGAALGRFGFKAPFVALAAVVALLAVPTLQWISQADIATSLARFSDMKPLLKRPGVQAAVASQLLIFGNIGVFDSVVDKYLTDLGADNDTVALALLALGLPLILLPSWAGSIADRGRPGRILVLALFFSVPAIASFGIWGTIPAFVMAGVVQGCVEAFAFPASQVLVLKETGAAELAIGQALLDSVGGAAAAATAVFAPLVYSEFGAGRLFGGYALIALGFALLVRSRVTAAREIKPMRIPAPTG